MSGSLHRRIERQIGGRRARVIAALAGFAWLAAQFAGLAHVASAPHVECREHGELEEITAVARPDGGTHAHRDVVIEQGGAPGGDHQHEHCVLASHARHSSAASTASAPVIVAIAPRAPPAPVVLAGSRSTVAVYRLAPKTSPPV